MSITLSEKRSLKGRVSGNFDFQSMRTEFFMNWRRIVKFRGLPVLTVDMGSAIPMLSKNRHVEVSAVSSHASICGDIPLDSSFASRADPAIRPSLTRGRNEFTYYPGAIRIPEGSAPNFKNKSWDEWKPSPGRVTSQSGHTAY
jgi:hypothetical protein